MENNQNNDKFEYSYSSAKQEEIRKIRDKYMPKEEDKLARLQKLDNAATNKATIAAMIIGVTGALIMGTGMSLIMTDIGAKLGMTEVMLPGIVIGLIGIVGIALAYPLYHKVLKKEREKIAPEILKLSEELLK